MSDEHEFRIRPGRIRSTRAQQARPFIAQALAAAKKAGGGVSRSGRVTSPNRSRFGRGQRATVQANPNWQFEAIVFYMAKPDANGNCPPGTQPVYRMYNSGQGAAPNHRYTTSTTVRSQMLAQGWIPEGYGPLGVIMCAPS